jgi:type VI protein secretion system component VasF
VKLFVPIVARKSKLVSLTSQASEGMNHIICIRAAERTGFRREATRKTMQDFDMSKRIEDVPEKETPVWVGALAIVVIIVVLLLFSFLFFWR